MSTPKGTGRKLMIVIQEEDGGNGFNVYLSGDKERIGRIPDSELGPAEFWGSRLFRICGQAIQQSGALKSVTQTGNDA